MKIFFIIALDLVFILVFFLFIHQKNKDLGRKFVQIENNIKSKQNLQLAIQNFKAQQEQVLLQNKKISDLEPLKYQTVNTVVNLINGLPAGISLFELRKLDDTIWVSGKVVSDEALKNFVNLHHLTLLKSKRLLFEVSGQL